MLVCAVPGIARVRLWIVSWAFGLKGDQPAFGLKGAFGLKEDDVLVQLQLQLLVALSPVNGSRMGEIGSVLKDVGVLGAGAGYCCHLSYPLW